MNIRYILSYPTSLVYHVFAQIDFQKEWGSASLFAPQYIDFLREHDKGLIVSDAEQKEIKENLGDYFILMTFAVLRPRYADYNKLIDDFSDVAFIAKKIISYPDLSLDKTDLAFQYAIGLMARLKNQYTVFWEKNEDMFQAKIKELESFQKNIFFSYYKYLNKKFSPTVPAKENYFVFVIPSLFNYGRGLEGGCAIGIPFSDEQKKSVTVISMHELTHAFSDRLLMDDSIIKSGITQDQTKIHQIKEQLAECILQEYLKQNYPEIANKKIISYPLLTEEIKKSLGV